MKQKKPVPVEVLQAADAERARAFRDYSLDELRYDWCCSIRGRTREILLAELKAPRRRLRRVSEDGPRPAQGGLFVKKASHG